MVGKREFLRQTVKNSEINGIERSDAYDFEFMLYLRTEVGNNSRVAKDTAYCLANLLKKWPIDFPNANKLRQLAMNVLDADFSKSYQRKALITIEKYARYLGIDGVKFKKPKPTQKQIHYLTDEEMGRLLDTADNRRDFTIILMLCKTGMRASELLDLNVCDVDFEKQEIAIHHGKGDKTRTIDFDKQAETALRAHVGILKLSPNSPLFLSRRGRRMSYKALHSMIATTGRKAGLSVHPHMLRHSFATAWVANEGDLFHLQGFLGHTELSMTRRYFHECPESRKSAYLKGVTQF